MGSKPGTIRINWKQNTERQIAVGLAFHHFAVTQIRNEGALYARVKTDFNRIAPFLLGRPFSWDDLKKQILSQYGLQGSVTPHKVYERGSKAKLYDEHPEARRLVFHALTGMKDEVDPIRFFTDDQLRLAIQQHGNECIYCAVPFNSIIMPVADHFIPHASGGRTSQHNCVPACVRCNQEKSDSHPSAFIRRLYEQGQKGRLSLVKKHG